MPDNFVAALSAWFRVMKADGGPLSADKRSRQGFHSFLAHLASRVDPVPRLEGVVLLQVDPDETVHVLNSLFSVPVDMYSTDRRIFACRGDLPR